MCSLSKRVIFNWYSLKQENSKATNPAAIVEIMMESAKWLMPSIKQSFRVLKNVTKKSATNSNQLSATLIFNLENSFLKKASLSFVFNFILLSFIFILMDVLILVVNIVKTKTKMEC